jgi:hypothetical protein
MFTFRMHKLLQMWTILRELYQPLVQNCTNSGGQSSLKVLRCRERHLDLMLLLSQAVM